mmetsp:Transcript_5788/g.7695  ORF Transcript_5788/g.7695 Transcript_5788/m.7695 type:complete len:400 (-) Transcript_5788:86-1285(-)
MAQNNSQQEDVASLASGFENSTVEQTLGNDGRSRLLMLGAKRSGKTSIIQVVFQKMSPHETLFLDPTAGLEITEVSNSAFVQLQILDFPGGYDFSDGKLRPEVVFKHDAAIVFVIDQQDGQEDLAAVEHFLDVARLAHMVNPKLSIDVLIHKVEIDSDNYHDDLNERVRHIRQVIIEQLREEQLDVHPTFHLTSIYDHTIFEAFSRIVQKRVPQTSQLEKILSGLVENSRVEKAYVFDVISKIYIATDNSDLDHFYELCSDAIDVVIDVSRIYSVSKDSKGGSGEGASIFPYDSKSGVVIRMENSYVLHLREVDSFLALVCVMRNDPQINQGLLEYNFDSFKKAVAEVKARSIASLRSGARSKGGLRSSNTPGLSDVADMKTSDSVTKKGRREDDSKLR